MGHGDHSAGMPSEHTLLAGTAQRLDGQSVDALRLRRGVARLRVLARRRRSRGAFDHRGDLPERRFRAGSHRHGLCQERRRPAIRHQPLQYRLCRERLLRQRQFLVQLSQQIVQAAAGQSRRGRERQDLRQRRIQRRRQRAVRPAPRPPTAGPFPSARPCAPECRS